MKYFQSQTKLSYLCLCFGIATEVNKCGLFFVFLPYFHTVRTRKRAGFTGLAVGDASLGLPSLEWWTPPFENDNY